MLPPLSRHIPFFLLFTALLFSCSGEMELCAGPNCTVLIPAGDFVRIEKEDLPRWYRFTGKELVELKGMYPGSTPLAYNDKLDLIASKSLSGDGMRISLYRGGEGPLKEIRTRNYPADEIASICMTDNGTLWLLHQGSYDGGAARQYVLSRGTIALEEWENFFLTSERDEDTFGGSVIEKPVGLFCGGNDTAVHITTFLYSGEAERRLLRLPRLSLLQVYLYRFDPRDRVMQPVTGFTPRGNGVVRAHFDSISGRFAVFQDGILSLQAGLGFPDERLYAGTNHALFAEKEGKLQIYLIDETPTKGLSGKRGTP